jgi:hypothetical protein
MTICRQKITKIAKLFPTLNLPTERPEP